MDSDFGRPISPRERYSPAPLPQQDASQPMPPQSEPRPPQPTHYKRSGWGKFFKFLLILLLIAGVAYGVYYWQNKDIQDLKKQLTLAKAASNQSDQEKKDLAAAKVKLEAAATSDSLIPGQVDTSSTDGTIMVTALYKTTTAPDEIWVEFGGTADNLDKTSNKVSKPSSTGTDTFSSTQLKIAGTAVKADTTYFYRVAAKKGAVTTHSAVASFTTAK